MQVLLALPSSHNVFCIHAQHDDVEGAAASAGAVRPHRLSIREAVCFPVALFRLWIRAQKSLMLPISSLSTEDIIQVCLCTNCCFCELQSSIAHAEQKVPHFLHTEPENCPVESRELV